MNTNPNKPRYALETQSIVTNGSWWIEQSRDRFTHYSWSQEWPRMRQSRFGRITATLATGPMELNAVDAYRERKRAAKRAGRYEPEVPPTRRDSQFPDDL